MKSQRGKVISVSMEKTATVLVKRVLMDPVYKKRQTKTKKYQIHNEVGAKLGDIVTFKPIRPKSKLKKWGIIGIATVDLNKKGKAKK